MTTNDIFTVAGRLKKWDINSGEFTMEAPVGDIVINIEKCDDLMLNEMIDAMKNRRIIEIKVVEERQSQNQTVSDSMAKKSYEDRERARMRKNAEECKGCVFYESIPGNIIGVCHNPERMMCANYSGGEGMTKEHHDCLNCSASMSDDDENGNMILRCVEHDGKIVDENDCCEDWN